MRVVHNSTKKLKLTKEPEEEWKDLARKYELDEHYAEAMEAYHLDVRANPSHENSWHRLMILYRKEKNPVRELQVIDDAIAAFEKIYAPGGKKVHGKKVETISRAFMKSTGLADNKGKAVYRPEPLGKWHQRRQLLAKRMSVTRKPKK